MVSLPNTAIAGEAVIASSRDKDWPSALPIIRIDIMSEPQLKSFLDTTVVRGLLIGTHVYRDFLRRVLGERLYVGRFVDMEFKRGVLLPLIDFLNTLAMSHIRTIGDAEKAWSHRFEGREVKLLLALTGDIFDRHGLNRTKARDKQRGIMALAAAIKSYDRAMRRRFIDPSQDRTHCGRGAQPLRASVSPEQARQDLNAYADQFGDVAHDRRTCHIREFFDHFGPDLTACVKHAESLPDLRKHDNVRAMAVEVKKIQDNTSVCSCATCERLGDVVIAVGAPRSMQVETTDQSFPHWCEPTRQPHRVLDGELKHLNDLGKTKATD